MRSGMPMVVSKEGCTRTAGRERVQPIGHPDIPRCDINGKTDDIHLEVSLCMMSDASSVNRYSVVYW